jgi:hypothetical protein
MFDPFDGKKGDGKKHSFIIGRVKDVILGENILDKKINPKYYSEKDMGAVYFEPLYSNKTEIKASSAFSKPAYPMFSFIRQYPNVGEIVLIFPGPSSDLNDNITNQDLWYLPSFAIWNDPNQNVFPNLGEYADFLKSEISKPGYSSTNKDYPNIPQGYTFQEKSDIKFLRPFEGDTIIQGRFGQSIRFGSTVSGLKSINNWSQGDLNNNGNPITIIVNSQKTLNSQEQLSPTVVEDINRDGSSIYLTSGQIIEMVGLNSFPNRSYNQGKGFNPQVEQVLIIEGLPTTNDSISPEEQDKNNYA